MKNEIVVGLDDSPSSTAALQWAAQQARSTGAVLRAVHALDWPYGASSTESRHQINPIEPTRASTTATGMRSQRCSRRCPRVRIGSWNLSMGMRASSSCFCRSTQSSS